MLFSVPVLSVSTYIEVFAGFEFGLILMGSYETGSEGFNAAFDAYVLEQTQERTPLIILNADGVTWEEGTNVSSPNSQINSLTNLELMNLKSYHGVKVIM